MSQDYRILYPELSLSRKDLMEIIGALFEKNGGKLDLKCYEIKFISDSLGYRYGEGELEFSNVEEALVQIQKWEGVNFEFEFEWGHLALYLWNDKLKSMDKTTLTLSIGSGLQSRQLDNEEEWLMFQKLCFDIAKKTNSLFWSMEPNAALKTVTKEEIISKLKSKDFKETKWLPSFVYIHQSLSSEEEIKQNVPSGYKLDEKNGFFALFLTDDGVDSFPWMKIP